MFPLLLSTAVVMIDIENPEDLRRYKWLNRFGTYYMPTTRHPKIIEKRVPTYYPGSKAIEPVKEVVVMKKGAGFTGGIRAGQTLGPPENKHISEYLAQLAAKVISGPGCIAGRRGTRSYCVTGLYV